MVVAGILLTAAVVARAAPATQPASATAPSPEEVARRVEQLNGEAIRAMKTSQYHAAERALMAAVRMQSGNPITLYNLGCVKAKRGYFDDAMMCLEGAAIAGFSDFDLVERDPDLDVLRDTERFKQFVGDKRQWQRKAAERTLGRLKREFGESYLYEIDVEQKLIFATGLSQQTLDEMKEALKKQAASQARDLFPHRPDAFISVVIPAAADYRKVVRASNVGGFYNEDNKLLIAQKVGTYLAHEFTHALHAGDRAPLGQDHAIWIAEGFGVLYEGASFLGDQLVPIDNERFFIARDAARRKALVPLVTLVKMPQEEFVRRGRVTYAEAGTLMLYLHDRGLLRRFYDTYKETYAQDETGRLALERETGQSLEALEGEYVEWLLNRPLMRKRK
jgi:hypothetical protein